MTSHGNKNKDTVTSDEFMYDSKPGAETENERRGRAAV